jgi:undecaprenyl-diphosphatase
LWLTFYALASTLTTAIVVNILKPLVDRPRPFEVYDSILKLTSGGGGSSPSGHTGDAFAIAVALCLVFRRWTVVLPALLWAFGVGWPAWPWACITPATCWAGSLSARLQP